MKADNFCKADTGENKQAKKQNSTTNVLDLYNVKNHNNLKWLTHSILWYIYKIFFASDTLITALLRRWNRTRF